jgi:hypothetical protein
MEALPPLDFTFAMGALSVAITLVAYAVLLRQIIWGTKRPSPIAWIGFGLCTGVGYLVQSFAGVHAGSWTMGVTAFFCFIVGVASILKGRRKTTFVDWIALALGLVTLGGWIVCVLYKLDQTLAAVLATVSDLLLYVPLIRAGWSHPELDSRMAYFLNTVKFVPALIITVPFTLATVLYSIALVVANSGMNLMLMLRESWLSGEIKLLHQVLFIERGVDQTINPERFKRHNIVIDVAGKIYVASLILSAIAIGIIYSIDETAGINLLFMLCGVVGFGGIIVFSLLSDKMVYNPSGKVSYSCPH